MTPDYRKLRAAPRRSGSEVLDRIIFAVDNALPYLCLLFGYFWGFYWGATFQKSQHFIVDGENVTGRIEATGAAMSSDHAIMLEDLNPLVPRGQLDAVSFGNELHQDALALERKPVDVRGPRPLGSATPSYHSTCPGKPAGDGDRGNALEKPLGNH